MHQRMAETMNRRRATGFTPHQRGGAGFTLIEVLVASAIGAVVAGGSVMAVVAASRMLRAQSGSGSAEAAQYAQQTLERFRNMIACSPPWFDAVTCAPVIAPGGLPTGWTNDPLPLATPGTETILTTVSKRCYKVTPQDCDGAPGNDCFNVEAQVCWNGTACPC